MVEYGSLKEEQRMRIGFRDNLLYAAFASMAAVVAAALQLQNTGLLLLLPPVSVPLGWTYLVNDQKISAIGRYVRDDIAPRLAALAVGPGGPPVFDWENAHRRDARRASRKYLQLGVDLLTFCAVPTVALIVFWLSSDATAALLVTSLIDASMLAALCCQIVLYADLSGPSTTPVGTGSAPPVASAPSSGSAPPRAAA
nr:hypothetical protein [Streptomyces sp. CBMA29]